MPQHSPRAPRAALGEECCPGKRPADCQQLLPCDVQAEAPVHHVMGPEHSLGATLPNGRCRASTTAWLGLHPLDPAPAQHLMASFSSRGTAGVAAAEIRLCAGPAPPAVAVPAATVVPPVPPVPAVVAVAAVLWLPACRLLLVPLMPLAPPLASFVGLSVRACCAGTQPSIGYTFKSSALSAACRPRLIYKLIPRRQRRTHFEDSFF